MEQAFGRGRRKERRRLRAAAGLAEDHHARRVAAERRDVVAHPPERRDHVHHAAHAGVLERLRCTGRDQMRVAEAREPVVHGDDDHVAEERQLAAVVHRAVGGAGRPAAAVKRHQHGAPAVVPDARRPDVERQAVFAHAADADVAIPGDELRVVGAVARRRLRGDRAVAHRVACAHPGRRLARRHEAVGAGRVGAVRNPAEHLDAGVRHAAHHAVGGLDIEEERAIEPGARRDAGRSAGRLHRRCRCLRDRHAPRARRHETGKPGLDHAAPRPIHCPRPGSLSCRHVDLLSR